MSDLIDDMLKLSRVTRCPLKPAQVDLSRIAQEVVGQLRQTQPQRQADVSIEPGLVVTGDPGLLRTALENLLGNAWKYTSRLARARIEFGARVEDGETVFFIRDNGAGFDMAHAGKLFGAFQRLHGPSAFEGSGIGLATVQRIIHRHGGRIWAEASQDQGATFHFTLPRSPTTTAGPSGAGSMTHTLQARH